MANIFNMVDTWNDAATTFTSIKMNTTDTASAAGSLLMDLQVGGVSRFAVDKTGYLSSPGFSSSSTFTRAGLETGTNANLSMASGSTFTFRSATTSMYFLDAGTFRTATSNTRDLGASGILWKAAYLATLWAGGNAALTSDAANTLAQRNGTNAQAFNLYSTFTDASNYERGVIKWNGSILEIGAEAAGTGSARTVRLKAGTGAIDFVTAAANTTGTRFYTPGNGKIAFLNSSNSNSTVAFGLANSSFSQIKGVGTKLEVRLADDSAFTNIQGKLTTETAYAAGAPTATGYLVLYDSAGTAYKVPAEAL